MNLDHLLGVVKVIPAPVTLPTFGDHLDKHVPERSVRNMSNAVAAGLDVDLQLLVLLDFMFFHVLEIHAGVFNGNILVAAGDLDGEARLWIGAEGVLLRRRRSRGRILGRARKRKQETSCEAKRGDHFSGEFHD